MKWTKFKLSNDKLPGLSLYEMPWLAGISNEGNRTVFKVKYLGPSASLSRWIRKKDGATVLFQQSPLRLIELSLGEGSGNADPNALNSVLAEFLTVELKDKPDSYELYGTVFREALRQAVDAELHPDVPSAQ